MKNKSAAPRFRRRCFSITLHSNLPNSISCSSGELDLQIVLPGAVKQPHYNTPLPHRSSLHHKDSWHRARWHISVLKCPAGRIQPLHIQIPHIQELLSAVKVEAIKQSIILVKQLCRHKYGLYGVCNAKIRSQDTKTTFQVSGREQDGLETERSFDALSGIMV